LRIAGLAPRDPFTDSTVELEMRSTDQTAGGQTALYDAIAKALEALQAGSRDKRVLIVVSDGGDNASRRKLDQVMKLAEQSSAVIYTIGVFDEDDEDRIPVCSSAWRRRRAAKLFFPASSAK
jgi:Ca-activated chloride channel homolog